MQKKKPTYMPPDDPEPIPGLNTSASPALSRSVQAQIGQRLRQFYDALAQQGRVVARFSPSEDGEPIPFDLEDLYSPFWWLDRYERPGPTITVYELSPH